jgi:hypothetical protein
MKRIARIAIGLALLGVLMVVEGCAGLFGGGGSHRLTNADVTLVSFGSINGELAPCG